MRFIRSVKYHTPFEKSCFDRSEEINYVESLIKFQQEPCQGLWTVKNRPHNESVATDLGVGIVIRSLNSKEIRTCIEDCACRCENWARIRLMYFVEEKSNDKSEDLSLQLKEQLSHCGFGGNVIIGLILSKTDSARLQPGIHNNRMITDCILEPGCHVYQNMFLSRTFIASTGTVLNCDSITFQSSSHDKGKSFQDTMLLNLGSETGGGRKVHVSPETTVIDICSSLSISSYQQNGIASKIIPANIIKGTMRNIHDATNIYMSYDTKIQSCACLSNVILLPHATISNCTSTIHNVYLQWNASIINNSSLTSTLLMEHASVGPNSTIESTILGPDTHVSCGEIHYSLIGPNTNSHHQSLILSALWPLGRGNVAYGSNIGSNHTARLPDQECTIGEGIFWGLGCNISFPVDLTSSPYSVIAAGVKMAPQRICMPFSVVLNKSDGDGRNEIVPAWVIQSSPYTILRSEIKFQTRRKAKRHGFYCNWKILRPGIINLCVNARKQLMDVSCSNYNQNEDEQLTESNNRKIYTEVELPELGKNFMTERGRNIGIQAYTHIIQLYALRALLEQVKAIHKQCTSTTEGSDFLVEKIEDKLANLFNENRNNDQNKSDSTNNSGIPWPVVPWEDPSNYDSLALWKHQRSILLIEFPFVFESKKALSKSFTTSVISTLFERLIRLEQDNANRVHKSKSRDDLRGISIIPGYAENHVMAENDAVVKSARKQVDMVTKTVQFLTKEFKLNIFDDSLLSHL